MKGKERANVSLLPLTSSQGSDCAYETANPPDSPRPCRKTRTGCKAAEACGVCHEAGRKSPNVRSGVENEVSAPRAWSKAASDSSEPTVGSGPTGAGSRTRTDERETSASHPADHIRLRARSGCGRTRVPTGFKCIPPGVPHYDRQGRRLVSILTFSFYTLRS